MQLAVGNAMLFEPGLGFRAVFFQPAGDQVRYLHRGQIERSGGCQELLVKRSVVVLVERRVYAEYAVDIQTSSSDIVVVHDIPLEYPRLLDGIQMDVYFGGIMLLSEGDHGHHRAGIHFLHLGHSFAHGIAGGDTVIYQ
jgi:hypothetical protein